MSISLSKTTRYVAAAASLTLALAVAGCSDPGSSKKESDSQKTSSEDVSSVDADASLNKLLPAKIRDAKQIVIATNAPYAPLEYFDTDNKTLIGYDIDLGNAVGAALGVKVKWENISFDSIVPGIQAGKYDAGMAGFSIEHERLDAVDFVSYYLSGGGFLIKQGSGIAVNTWDGLCGYRVAVQKGVSQVDALQHASTDCVEEGKKPIQINQIPDQNVVVLSLKSGRADVVVGDKPQVEYAAKHTSGLCVVSTYQTSHSIAGIAVPKGQTQLTKALQAAVTKLIKDGTYEKISEHWGTGVANPKVKLSADYAKLAAPWGVGPDGTVVTSRVFTNPDEIKPGHVYYYQPVNKGCA